MFTPIHVSRSPHCAIHNLTGDWLHNGASTTPICRRLSKALVTRPGGASPWSKGLAARQSHGLLLHRRWCATCVSAVGVSSTVTPGAEHSSAAAHPRDGLGLAGDPPLPLTAGGPRGIVAPDDGRPWRASTRGASSKRGDTCRGRAPRW